MSSAGGAEGTLSNSPSVLSLARAEDRREAPPKKAALLAADADDGADEGPSEESLLYIATRFHGVPSEDLLLLSNESASSGVRALVLKPSSPENSPERRDSMVPTIDLGRGFGATGGGGRPPFRAVTVLGELPGVLS